jgi:hypothetical protein
MNIRDFRDLPIEKETRLLSRQIMELDGIICAHENWTWDGIYGESLIFYQEDLKGKNDNEIFNWLSGFYNIEYDQSTIKRTEKFIFINFNFEVK